MVFEGLVFATGVIVQIIRWMFAYVQDDKKVWQWLKWIVPMLILVGATLLVAEHIMGEALWKFWYESSIWFAVATIFFAFFVAFGTSQLLVKIHADTAMQMMLFGIYWVMHWWFNGPLLLLLGAGGILVCMIHVSGHFKKTRILLYYTTVLCILAGSGMLMFIPLSLQYDPIPLWENALLGSLFLFVTVHTLFLSRWIAMLTTLVQRTHRSVLFQWLEEHVRLEKVSPVLRVFLLLITVGTIGVIAVVPMNFVQEAQLLVGIALLCNEQLLWSIDEKLA